MSPQKMRASARGEACTVRIPGVCNHNPETTVLAHINGIRFGHGMGRKTHWGAYACSDCHDVVDGRVDLPGYALSLIKLMHYEGVFETLDRMLKKGLL